MKKSEKTRWWEDARFGMFIHWGVYAVPAVGEWVMYHHKIKIEDYEKLAGVFNPVKYDPRAWTQMAADAGMKYMVLTTKHHDGFCLFDSKLTGYTSVKTAAKRDLVREYVEACREKNLGVGLYYSIRDWHHPNYPFPAMDPVVLLEPEARQPDHARYLKYLTGQLEELLTNYGKIDILWIDGRDPIFDGRSLAAKIRKLQPDILINERLLSGDEDFITPEQAIPVKPLIKDGRELVWESCNTMTGNSWGYNKYDKAFRSPKELLQLLVSSTSSGGNCLLNIGPCADGTIQLEIQVRLRELGRWLRKYGESIYCTQAGPACHPEWGRMTRRGNTVYLHVFDWPANGKLQLPPVTGTLESVRLMTGEILQVNGKTVTVPVACPCEMDTVLMLEYADAPGFIEPHEPAKLTQKIDYEVVPGKPIEVDGEMVESEWCGAKKIKVTQDTNFDYSRERYPGSVKYGYCAYTFRAMHAGNLLYLGFEVESPTRLGRCMKYESGDEVRIVLAGNIEKENNGWNPETFEITVDACGNTCAPSESNYPGVVFRHAVKHTQKGYNVVVAVPFSIMLKDMHDPASGLRPGDLFKFNVLVVQPAPEYKKQLSRKPVSEQEWWDKIIPLRPGPAHRVFWRGHSTAEDPFRHVKEWGLCKLLRK